MWLTIDFGFSGLRWALFEGPTEAPTFSWDVLLSYRCGPAERFSHSKVIREAACAASISLISYGNEGAGRCVAKVAPGQHSPRANSPASGATVDSNGRPTVILTNHANCQAKRNGPSRNIMYQKLTVTCRGAGQSHKQHYAGTHSLPKRCKHLPIYWIFIYIFMSCVCQ